MSDRSGVLRKHPWRAVALFASIVLAIGVGGMVAAPAALADSPHTVTVNVTNAVGGAPLSGVEVSALSTDPEAEGASNPAGGVTNGSGQFVFSDVDLGNYVVFMQATGFGEQNRTVLVDTDTADHADPVINVALSAATGQIDGSVEVAGTGGSVPISDAQITVILLGQGEGGHDDGLTNSSPEGEFALSDVAAGDYRVDVSADGYISQSQDITVEQGGHVTLDFPLAVQHYGSISGTVRATSDDEGIAGISVVALAPNGDFLEFSPVITADDGTYTLTGVPIGTGYTLEFWDDATIGSDLRAPAYETVYLGRATTQAAATTFDLAADENLTGEDIELDLGGTIEGHTLMESYDGSIDPNPASWSVPDLYHLVHGSWVPVVNPSNLVGGTGVGGDWEWRGVPAGNYRLGFIDPDTGPRGFATQFWNGASSVDSATTVTVTAGHAVTGIDTLLLPRHPHTDALMIAALELFPAQENYISTDLSTYERGSTAVITVGTHFAGEWVSVWLHSSPTNLGGWMQVAADGTVRVTIPSSAADSTNHQLVVQDIRNVVIGWKTITVSGALTAFTHPLTPVITGSLHVGRTLTAHPGKWKPSGAIFHYLWKANGTPITGGTGPTLVLAAAQYGKRITVTVTGSLDKTATKSKTSSSTGAVGLGTITPAKPTVSGSFTDGSVLTAVPGKWAPGPVEFSYQWLLNDKAIPGAWSPTFTVVKADIGGVITVRVKGSAARFTSMTSTSSKTNAKVPF